jgi:hypothetical protein
MLRATHSYLCGDGGIFLVFAAIAAPWGYYLGGHFHFIPMWNGMGTAHTPAGDFVFFVTLYPDLRHPGRYNTWLTGNGFLCTPKGERMHMRTSGSMEKHLAVDTQGKTIHIYMHRTSTWASFMNSDYRPSIAFEGSWGKDEISGDDRNSLGKAFEPDGSVYLGHSATRGSSFRAVQFTLHGASSSDFQKACTAKM